MILIDSGVVYTWLSRTLKRFIGIVKMVKNSSMDVVHIVYYNALFDNRLSNIYDTAIKQFVGDRLKIWVPRNGMGKISSQGGENILLGK